MISWLKLPEKMRFLIVGGYNTAFSYIIFTLTYLLFGNNLHEQLILAISYLISSANTYLSLKLFVFKAEGKWYKQYIKSFMTSSSGYILNAILLSALMLNNVLNVLVAQLIATIIVAVYNYFAHKYFSFKELNFKLSKSLILLIFIICLGLGLRGYALSNKQYYHHDEVFSLELINDDSWAKQRLNADNYNKFISGDIFLQDVVISEEEKLNYSFNSVLKYDDIHPPLFYWVLHIFQSLLADDKDTFIPGIILNILCYIVTALFLYRLSLFLLKDRYYALFPVLVFSVSPAIISTDMLVRMYSLFGMFAVMFVYYCLILLKNKSNEWGLYAKLGIICLLGALTHHYFLCLALISYIIISCYLLKDKNYQSLKSYTAAMLISGIVYLVIWPVVFYQVLFSKLADRITTLFGSLSPFSELIYMTNVQLLSNLLAPLLLIIITLYIVYKNKLKNVKPSKYYNLITAIFIVMTFVIFKTQPFSIAGGAYRYFYVPNIFLILLTCAVLVYLINLFNIKKLYKNIILSLFAIVFVLSFNIKSIDNLYVEKADKESLFYEFKNLTDDIVFVKTAPVKAGNFIEGDQKDWTIVKIMPLLYNKKQLYIINEEKFDSQKLNDILSNIKPVNNIYLIANEDDKVIDLFNAKFGIYKSNEPIRYKTIHKYEQNK